MKAYRFLLTSTGVVAIFSLLFSLLASSAGASINYSDLISNAVFDNTATMSSSQIDAFLNSFPDSCISTANGFSAADPTGYTPTSSSIYGRYSYGSRTSAGKIIYDAAKSHQINPQVILATLEKEETLVSGSAGCSSWRYTSAVGYGCTDSGANTHDYSYPGGGLLTPLYYINSNPVNSITDSCVNRAEFAGFSEQIIHAAWLASFSRHRAEGQSTWAITSGAWNHCDDNATCAASLNIPDSWACYSGFMTQGTWARCSGGSTAVYDGYATIDGSAVHIDNGATAALYVHTPHKSGNSNFVTIFTAWFGSTLYPWAAEITRQDFYSTLANCQNNTSPISLSGAQFKSGQQYWVKITATNDGSQSWSNTFVKISTADPYNHVSALSDGGWPSGKRPAYLSTSTVAPTDSGVFNCFSITAPSADGTYSDHFQLVAENKSSGWMEGDATFTLGITVSNPYNATLTSVSYFKDSARTQPFTSDWSLFGDKIYVRIKAKNIGTQTWSSSFAKVATANPTNRSSVFCDGSWSSCGRPALLQESSVAPGQTGTFEFSMTAPSTENTYTEAFQLVAEGQSSGWMPNTVFSKSLRVLADPPDRIATGQRLYPGNRLDSSNGKYYFAVQGDGNLVIYSPYRAIWSSHTNGRRPSSLVAQGDGNLVLYKYGGGVIWASRTNGNTAAVLVMQNDGNLVLYASGHAVWSTHTNGAI